MEKTAKPFRENKERAVLWASPSAPLSKQIIICSTEDDAHRVHNLTEVATVALRALPLDARERLASRHIVLALRDDAKGAAIMLELGKISADFASYKRLERVDQIVDAEIQSLFKRLADPLKWDKLPLPPTATGFRLRIRSQAQREAVHKYVGEHPGEFPVILYDFEKKIQWVEQIKETAETSKFFRHWFGGNDFVYVRADWAF